MTAPDSADTMIRAAVDALEDTEWYQKSSYVFLDDLFVIARALHAVGLLADPADRDELEAWRSGRRRKSWPSIESVPDGLHYAAELVRAQGTEGGDTHDALLRGAAARLKALNDIAPVLLAEKERAEAEVAELRATVDRVRAIHREVAIYAYDDTNGVFKQDANGEHIRIESICAECSSDDAIEAVENCEWSADWGHHEIAWPCDTIRALDGAGESDGE